MKTKYLDTKINFLNNLIKSLRRKYETPKAGKAIEKLNTLESDLEAAITLQKEVKTLKTTLKTRKKDLENGVEKLKKDKKEFKKAEKSDKKEAKTSRVKEKQKETVPSETKSPVSRKKLKK